MTQGLILSTSRYCLGSSHDLIITLNSKSLGGGGTWGCGGRVIKFIENFILVFNF